MLPLPPSPHAWALFLDFDGTLTEIAASPDAVRIDADLPSLLGQLETWLGGAVAIVSGRPIAQIDTLLAPARLPVAGLHGLERRLPDGRMEQTDTHRTDLDSVKKAMTQLAATDNRLLLEDKQLTVALHYRQAPDKASLCRKTVQSAVLPFPALEVLEGKMVLEARPVDMNKGVAVQALMAVPPFRGRVPVMVGDDVTDEDGFQLVNDLQGITVKVGPGATRAGHRLDGVGDVLIWLKQMRDSLAAGDS